METIQRFAPTIFSSPSPPLLDSDASRPASEDDLFSDDAFN